MKKIKIKINHRDSRGSIIDLLEKKNINAITLITQKKGKIRGNHFHKKTIQWNYLLKGKIQLVAKKRNASINKSLNPFTEISHVVVWKDATHEASITLY